MPSSTLTTTKSPNLCKGVESLYGKEPDVKDTDAEKLNAFIYINNLNDEVEETTNQRHAEWKNFEKSKINHILNFPAYWEVALFHAIYIIIHPATLPFGFI